MKDSELDQHSAQQVDASERLFEELVKVISASYDKASAYTNLVMVAGYATFFATWAYTRDHLTPLTELGAAICILISATTFVLWEIAKMFYSAWSLKDLSSVLPDDSSPKNPVVLQEHFRSVARRQARVGITFHKFWLVQLGVAVSTAVLAIAILSYGLIYGLFVSYSEFPH